MSGLADGRRTPNRFRAALPASTRIAIALCLSAPPSLFAQTQMPSSMDMGEHAEHATQTQTKEATPPTPDEASGASDASRGTKSKQGATTTQPQSSAEPGAMQGMDRDMTGNATSAGSAGMDHAGMGHTGMDHAGMNHSGADPAAVDQSGMAGMDHGTMQDNAPDSMAGMDAMQGGRGPADARDPDYSDGVTDHPMSAADMATMDMHDDGVLGSVLIDQLESFDDGNGHGQAIDAQAWLGNDLDRLWFKADGARRAGRLEHLRTEALWNHAVSPYWSMQSGVRRDFGEGPDRTWAAIGLQGLAPYWFEVEATFYAGQSGRTALRVEAEYELLLTQRLILQPDVELNVYGKDDPALGIGAGVSDVDAGVRLRYEVTRKFAPYVGVSWSRKFGTTADFARTAFGDVEDTQLVAGVRVWF